MALIDDAKIAFNSLAPADSPNAVRSSYSEYRTETKKVFAYFAQSICYRDIYEFDGRFLGVEWQEPRPGYDVTINPATRAYEAEQHEIISYTYTELL